MANGVASALRLGARYQRRNHGLECAWGIQRSTSEREEILQAPKARSCDCRRQEAPYDKGVWGSVVSSPSGVWGSAPETDAILNNFLAKRSTFWALVNLIFCNNQIEKRRLNLLNNYMKKF